MLVSYCFKYGPFLRPATLTPRQMVPQILPQVLLNLKIPVIHLHIEFAKHWSRWLETKITVIGRSCLDCDSTTKCKKTFSPIGEIGHGLVLGFWMLILLGVIRKTIKGYNKGPYSQSYGFSSNHVWMWELAHKGSWALKNWCFWTVMLEKTLESPWNAKRSNQSILKTINPEYHWKDWCWSWSSNTLATWWEELTHYRRPWCSERLKAGGEGDDRGWDGWMASPTWWTWVWAHSGKWWLTEKPGVLQSMGSQRALHDWGAEQQKGI